MKDFKLSVWIIGVIVFSAFFIFSAIIFQIFAIDVLPSQFYGALIGVVITAIITVLLLKGQTDNAEKLEKNVKIFEHKQEVYHAFMDKLHEIVKDGEITINKDKDELKELIFQLGYMQMHASKDTMEHVLNSLSNIIQEMNDFYSLKDIEKQEHLANFYADFSHELFAMVAVLKNDLYGEKCEPVEKEKMNSVLQDCGLYVQTDEINPKEIQCYFWQTLQNLLIEKGYTIPLKDFTADVNEYYARARNRHRYFGVQIPVYTTKENEQVFFSINIENFIHYGFKHLKNSESDTALCNIIAEQLPNFKPTIYWTGFKYDFALDFWKRNTEGIKKLQNQSTRGSFMKDFVKEIDIYIQQVVTAAKQKNL